MKKNNILIPLLLLNIIYCWGDDLHFDNYGDLKILQISDTHFKNGAQSKCEDYKGECTSLKTIKFIKKALEFEKPDLVVFSGDLIDPETNNAKWSLDMLLSNVISGNYKFAAILGNHDGESTFTRKEVIQYVCSKKGAVCSVGNDNIYGYGNYILNISNNNILTNQLLFLDSGATGFNKDVEYNWIHLNQLNYVNNNINRDVNKIVFFHIPLLDYTRAVLKYPISGYRYENECPSNIDSGLFGVLHNIGNVVSVNVGHDHINDYCVENYGINLCYAGGSGYSTYGKLGFERRMRVILLENYGKNVKTWKILDGHVVKRIDEEYLKFDGLKDKYINRRIAFKKYDKCLIVLVIFYIFIGIIFLFIIYQISKKNVINKLKLLYYKFNILCRKKERRNSNINNCNNIDSDNIDSINSGDSGDSGDSDDNTIDKITSKKNNDTIELISRKNSTSE